MKKLIPINIGDVNLFGTNQRQKTTINSEHSLESNMEFLYSLKNGFEIEKVDIIKTKEGQNFVVIDSKFIEIKMENQTNQTNQTNLTNLTNRDPKKEIVVSQKKFKKCVVCETDLKANFKTNQKCGCTFHMKCIKKFTNGTEKLCKCGEKLSPDVLESPRRKKKPDVINTSTTKKKPQEPITPISARPQDSDDLSSIGDEYIESINQLEELQDIGASIFE